MAITAATDLSGFSGFLNREQSGPIFEKVAEQSVVQRLAREVPLGANGRAIPVFTADPAAGWVAEGAEKPKTAGAMTLKTMDPKKLAAIFVVSEEVVRANPGGFMTEMRNKVAGAFALAFDLAALHGTSSPFAADIADTTKSIELGTTAQADGGVYGDLVAGLKLLVEDDKELTGFAASPIAEPLLLEAVDTSGRPIFVDTPPSGTAPSVRGGTLIGRPVAISKAVHASGDVRLFGGDWSQAAYGVVGGINYTVSNQATVTIDSALVSLWENNLVAVRAEAEYGFLINDTAAFVEYVDAVS